MMENINQDPLIIAISLGLLFYVLAIPVPTVITEAGNYLSKMTLPLALL
nr:hypothetical protein [Vibrio taketomensis]